MVTWSLLPRLPFAVNASLISPMIGTFLSCEHRRTNEKSHSAWQAHRASSLLTLTSKVACFTTADLDIMISFTEAFVPLAVVLPPSVEAG